MSREEHPSGHLRKNVSTGAFGMAEFKQAGSGKKCFVFSLCMSPGLEAHPCLTTLATTIPLQYLVSLGHWTRDSANVECRIAYLKKCTCHIYSVVFAVPPEVNLPRLYPRDMPTFFF